MDSSSTAEHPSDTPLQAPKAASKRVPKKRRARVQAGTTSNSDSTGDGAAEMKDFKVVTVTTAPGDANIPMAALDDKNLPAGTADERKWPWTARVPGQIMPTVVGPVGMGLCWKKLSIAWGHHSLEIVSWVILGWTVFQMGAILLALAFRYIKYPGVSVKELRHPTHYIFGIFVPLYLCLISAFVLNWSQLGAKILWYIGFGTMVIFMVYSCYRLFTIKLPVAQMHAFLLFGPLPILLAVQLAPYAPKDLLFFGWASGTIWYFGLHVLLAFRWIHLGLPRKPERASMWLILAASADSVLGYAASSENGFGEVAKAIFFFAILQFLTLVVLSPQIFASGFVPAWWMTTLPCTAFSSCWLSYGLSIQNQGVIITGTVLVGCATVWILILYLLSIIWIIRKDFWPKSPYRPDIERLPLE